MKKHLLLSFFFLFFTAAFAQNPLVKQWDKRFGGTGEERLFSLQETKDGGFILGGISLSGIGGDKTQPNWNPSCIPNCSFDYWIVKVDSIGNKQWDKTFGGINDEILRDLKQTNDGGYILGGQSQSGISGDKTQNLWGGFGDWDYWILKLDSMGNIQWDKDFGGFDSDGLYSLNQTADGGFIFAGVSLSGIGGNKTQPVWGVNDMWIIKTDSLGNIQWDKNFGGIKDEHLFSVQQTFDCGYILGGSSISGISGDKTQPNWDPSEFSEDYWIVKIDSLGNKQWDKRFGGTEDDALYSLQQTVDGGYIMGGMTSSMIGGDKTANLWGGGWDWDYWIVKIDSVGNKQWDKDYGGLDYESTFGNISQTSDSGFLFAGGSRSHIGGDKSQNNLGVEQTWVIKTNSLGSKIWDKTLLTISPSLLNYSGYAAETRDGCFAMVNYNDGDIAGDKTQPSWNNSLDYWLIKFCDSTLTSLNNNQQTSTFNIYPNPFEEELTISNSQFANSKAEITVTDILGRKIYSAIFLSANCKLKTTDWNKGIYFLEITSNGQRVIKKVLKQ